MGWLTIWEFIPRLTEISEPLRQLLCKDTTWLWSDSQQRAFEHIKTTLTSANVKTQVDRLSSQLIPPSTDIGSVLLQIQDDGNSRPISYALRSLIYAEKRYAIIEKEALAKVWACEKFSE